MPGIGSVARAEWLSDLSLRVEYGAPGILRNSETLVEHAPIPSSAIHHPLYSIRRRRPSLYFSAVWAITSAGRRGAGGRLFQVSPSR
uniref:Uncharacterized protein n=1 Tax=Candidatus Kentrum sp. LFY TaxID=2126342 RepID=A0A450V3D1_9GAMM|nr:MAG: hypothetical protein BECKLFY1418B_GA0070995_11387 [Candidatus Kentron sp. LFY]